MKTINATFLRNHIAETWKMARKEPLAVESRGQTEFVILTTEDYLKLKGEREPRRAGYAAHLFRDVDVDLMLETPIPGIDEYQPK